MMAQRAIVIAGRPVIVRELTVSEVREWAVTMERGDDVDAVGELVMDGCTLADLSMMSDATAAFLEELTASQLEALAAACKAANPHFFRIREALRATVGAMAAEAYRALADQPAAGKV